MVLNKYVKLIISLVAVSAIIVRIMVPEIKIDATILILVGIAVLPWIASAIESLELPGGFKVQLRTQSEVDTTDTSTPAPENEPKRITPSIPEDAQVTMLVPDSYSDKAVKLTPVETIVGFIVTNAVILPYASFTVPLLLLGLINVLLWMTITPLYLWRFQRVDQPSQLIVSTFALGVWAFAIGGPFQYLDWYEPLYGALALLIYTLLGPFLVR